MLTVTIKVLLFLLVGALMLALLNYAARSLWRLLDYLVNKIIDR